MTARLADTLRYLRSLRAGSFLALAVAALTVIGLVALSSAGRSFSSDPYFIFRRQLMWLVVAIVAGFVAVLVDLEKARKLTWLGVAGALLLLALVLVPGLGVTVNGARRWLDLGPMRLQPSDLGKVMLVFALAHYYASYQRQRETFLRGFIVPGGLVGLFAGVILLEPDFGTAFLFGTVGCCMMFLAGVRFLYLIPTGLSALGLFSVAVYLDPVRMRRITSFMDVEANKSDSAYQLWQGLLAFGTGGVEGVGLGNGRQQLSYLPEAHTDFIFPVIGEELGFVVTGLIVLLFLVLFACGTVALRRAPNLFQFLLVTGSLLFLTLQALINMGVVTGLLPTKGMSLPFISYGGSNLVVMFLFTGIIINCLRSWEEPVLRRPREL